MRLFCECKNQLTIAHSVKIDLVSNFTYLDGVLTLTKHQIRNSQNIKQKLKLDEVDRLYCQNCGNKYKDIENLSCQCDECGNFISMSDVKEIGVTIVLCATCLAKYKHFQDFKIFGLRGPNKKTRKKRLEESLDVNGMREMPEEIQQIYSDALGRNVVESPPETLEERDARISREQLREQLRAARLLDNMTEVRTSSPEEQDSPEREARFGDFSTSSNWNFTRTTSSTEE